MQYIEVVFNSNPYSEDIYDILSSNLSDVGFESFVQSDKKLQAYIVSSKFSSSIIDKIIEDFYLDVDIKYTFKTIEEKNWNEEWEKNFFKPIVFDNRCIVRSSFHKPEKEFEYQILIDPKMSFGTGHHQTTHLMINEILNIDFQNKTVLDMGCGTAILAILASMRNAEHITAIDIDKWAYDNALENVRLNNIDNIDVRLGGAELLGTQTYDIIFANINLNILLKDIPNYVNVLNKQGTLILSGFYKDDIPAIKEKCIENGLTFNHYSEKDNWVTVVCKK